MNIIEKLGITKAPWEYIDNGESRGIFEKDIGNREEWERESIFVDFYNTGCREFYAPDDTHKRVLAAAPEMLEALIGIVEYLPDLKSLPIKTKTDHGEATRKIILTIQKATNKSWEQIKELIK